METRNQKTIKTHRHELEDYELGAIRDTFLEMLRYVAKPLKQATPQSKKHGEQSVPTSKGT